MSEARETLHRLQNALLHLQSGLHPFVQQHLSAKHGANWRHYASRSAGGDQRGDLDAYALLKTLQNNWADVFAGTLPRNARSFMFTALDARNAWAHPPLTGIASDDALRYLDAIHQLLLAVRSAEAAAVKALHQEQVRLAAGAADTSAKVTSAPEQHLEPEAGGQAPVARMKLPAEVAARHTDVSATSFQRTATHRDRIVDFILKSPGRDDDEIASTLGISPRQSVNMICRKLSEEGLIRRQRGASGKLVNLPVASGSGSSAPPPSPSIPARTGLAAGALSEDEVKASLLTMLKVQGWSTEVAWGKLAAWTSPHRRMASVGLLSARARFARAHAKQLLRGRDRGDRAADGRSRGQALHRFPRPLQVSATLVGATEACEAHTQTHGTVRCIGRDRDGVE